MLKALPLMQVMKVSLCWQIFSFYAIQVSSFWISLIRRSRLRLIKAEVINQAGPNHYPLTFSSTARLVIASDQATVIELAILIRPRNKHTDIIESTKV